MEIKDFLLRTLLVSLGVAVVSLVLTYILSYLFQFGSIVGYLSIVVLVIVTAWLVNMMGLSIDDLFEFVLLFVCSIAMVGIFSLFIQVIPSLFTEFNLISLITVLMSFFISDSFVNKYILR